MTGITAQANGKQTLGFQYGDALVAGVWHTTIELTIHDGNGVEVTRLPMSISDSAQVIRELRKAIDGAPSGRGAA